MEKWMHLFVLQWVRLEMVKWKILGVFSRLSGLVVKSPIWRIKMGNMGNMWVVISICALLVTSFVPLFVKRALMVSSYVPYGNFQMCLCFSNVPLVNCDMCPCLENAPYKIVESAHLW